MGKFSADLTAFAKKANRKKDAVIRKVVLDLGEAIVDRTPVGDPVTWKYPAPAGYVGGRARGSWNYGFNAAPAALSQVDKSGDTSVARIRSGLDGNETDGVHFITNSLPYMKRLEYEGWSSQAPAGMVRITVAEFNDFVERAAADARRDNR